MATINDIVNLDSRRGDVAAGGGNAGAFNIDTQPLSTLSLYTNSYNQVLYNQTVQDRNEKIKQVAEVAKIDANNLYGKDKDYLVKKLNNLRDVATQYAKNPNLTIDDQLKWQTALSDVNNDYQSGKQRAVTYHAQLDELNKSHSGQEKEILLKELNDKMENTDISTPISAGTGYKPVAVNLPKPIQSEYQMSYNDGNIVTTANVGVLVPKWNMPLATTTVMGLSSLTKGLSGTEAELQSTANGEAQHWAAMTEPVNAALQEKDANGNYKYFDKDASGEYQFNYDKFKTAKSSDLVVMPAIDAIVNASKYSIQKKNEVTQGVFTDKNITYQAPSNLKPSDFDLGIINISPDGVTANQLAFGGLYQKYEGDKITKTFKETDLGIAQQNADTARMNARTNQAELGLKREEFKYKKEHPEAKTPKGETTLDTPAILFGNHIERLKDRFKDPKVLTVNVPVNKIDKDTRQAMGITPENMGDIQGVSYRKDGSYEINFKNNETTDASGNKVRQEPIIGTIEQLKQGFIDAVRGGNTNAQGFQEKSEQGFSDNFGGFVDGKQIWDNWNAKPSGNATKDNSATQLTPLKENDYYSSPTNLVSEDGGVYTFKDGSVWEVKDGKFKQIK